MATFMTNWHHIHTCCTALLLLLFFVLVFTWIFQGFSWICLVCLHGFVILLHGYVKVVDCICQSCDMYICLAQNRAETFVVIVPLFCCYLGISFLFSFILYYPFIILLSYSYLLLSFSLFVIARVPSIPPKGDLPCNWTDAVCLS